MIILNCCNPLAIGVSIPSPLVGEGNFSARGTSARKMGEGCKMRMLAGIPLARLFNVRGLPLTLKVDLSHKGRGEILANFLHKSIGFVFLGNR